MARPRHLLTVCNLSNAKSALDARLEVRLGWPEELGRGAAEADGVYVWWGRPRSLNQPQPQDAEQQAFASGSERWVPMVDHFIIEPLAADRERAFFAALAGSSHQRRTLNAMTLCSGLRRSAGKGIFSSAPARSGV